MRVNPIVALVIIAVWLYVLSVTHRAKLHAWEFIIGSLGLFTILMMTVQPVLTMPLVYERKRQNIILKFNCVNTMESWKKVGLNTSYSIQPMYSILKW